jgi:hypothetical protein
VPVAFSTFMCCIRSRTLMALFSAFQILFYRHANLQRTYFSHSVFNLSLI